MADIAGPEGWALMDALDEGARRLERFPTWDLALSWWHLLAELAGAADAEFKGAEAYAQERVGDILVHRGHTGGAMSAFQASLDIAKRLAARDGDNAGAQRDLFVSLWKIAGLLIDMEKKPEALAVAQRARDQAVLIATRFPQDPEGERYLRSTQDLLDRASRL